MLVLFFIKDVKCFVILFCHLLELSCCKNRQKKVPTKKLVWGIGNRERLKGLNDIKLVLNEHEWRAPLII